MTEPQEPGDGAAVSAAAPAAPRRAARMKWVSELRDRVRSTPAGRLVWKIIVTVLGVLVLAIGVVLLPLPGPGWVIIFAGLGILSTEYTWAARLLRSVKHALEWWRAWMKRRSRAVEVLISVLSLLFLAAVLVGCFFLYKLV